MCEIVYVCLYIYFFLVYICVFAIVHMHHVWQVLRQIRFYQVNVLVAADAYGIH